MAKNRLGFIFLILIVLSSCNSYQLYRDSSHSLRPIKYNILTDPDRHADRMKQYHDTVTQLRLWRRYFDESNDDDDIVQELLDQQKSSEYYKR